MSIVVEQLSKAFGKQKAVDAVNFSIEPGQTCGFLGPNGAGKSTTLKMITGFLQPTSGKVTVHGIDVLNDPLEAKKHIGYLAEHNPLYLDMYVREFLGFIANVHGLKGKKAAADLVIEKTGLEREAHKVIGSLSKGYRQRVGLAQALIHDPEVVILDEPLSGLDPNQLGELREVIRGLGQEKTVIFSSHILQEVEQVSDRILVINNGQLVADSPAGSISSQANNHQSIVEVEFLEAITQEQLQLLNQLGNIQVLNDRHFEISSGDLGLEQRKALFNFATIHHLTLITLKEKE
ncbi:MAG: ATP-binding cassette domain-containing protein, partial [Saprospiraceae bacterium]|nr:ATP-binding cassette domain-containing protein [Saprospiraceae bacterium]